MSTTYDYFNADGSRFNAATDHLELHSFTIACAKAITVEEALRRGHLHPSSLDGVPTSFCPHRTIGELLTRDIPVPGWAGVRVGVVNGLDRGETRRGTKKAKPTHASLCALRNHLGKASGSPKRWM